MKREEHMMKSARALTVDTSNEVNTEHNTKDKNTILQITKLLTEQLFVQSRESKWRAMDRQGGDQL